MKVYESNHEDVVDDIIQMLEQETGNKIFTFKVLDRIEEGLDVIVVFDDKSVLMGLISVQQLNGKLACRIRGNYI